MFNSPYQRLRASLRVLYGSSIYGALLLVVFGGLVIPAIFGSYVLVGVHERQSARTSLNEALQRNTDRRGCVSALCFFSSARITSSNPTRISSASGSCFTKEIAAGIVTEGP
jgi:putative copper export protein